MLVPSAYLSASYTERSNCPYSFVKKIIKSKDLTNENKNTRISQKTTEIVFGNSVCREIFLILFLQVAILGGFESTLLNETLLRK